MKAVGLRPHTVACYLREVRRSWDFDQLADPISVTPSHTRNSVTSHKGNCRRERCIPFRSGYVGILLPLEPNWPRLRTFVPVRRFHCDTAAGTPRSEGKVAMWLIGAPGKSDPWCANLRLRGHVSRFEQRYLSSHSPGCDRTSTPVEHEKQYALAAKK